MATAIDDNSNAQPVRITGADASGLEQTPVQSTAQGGLHTNLRDADGNERGIEANPVETRDKQANIKLLNQFLANSNFLKTANFTSIVPTFSGDNFHYDYYEFDARIARATVRYVDDTDWDITLQRFINDADGDELLNDDSTFLNLD
jgi:hypothetical protein